jgi:hypothetical protein
MAALIHDAEKSSSLDADWSKGWSWQIKTLANGEVEFGCFGRGAKLEKEDQ